MAGVVETCCPLADFPSENSLSGRPHTPPYTPSRLEVNRSKRTRLDRSHSPASLAGSVHPAETTSPANTPAKKRIATDDIKVEEISEHDVGYMGDVDVIHPYDTESADSNDHDSDAEQDTATDMSDTEATNLTKRLSGMRFGDARDRVLETKRQRRQRERRGIPTSKRTHSTSVRGEPEALDPEAMDDHDLECSKRRLRRRTLPPEENQWLSAVILPSMSSENSPVGASPGSVSEHHEDESTEAEAMDVDNGIWGGPASFL